MPGKSDANVTAWLDEQPADSIWITSVTVFEINFGIALLPVGKRRRQLQSAFDQLVTELLEDRVLDFDCMAAVAAASLAAGQRSAGKTLDFRDTQIAGIVVARRAALATRNLRHFAGLEVDLVNPWE
jgi:predicted nucleic acid-binding protein